MKSSPEDKKSSKEQFRHKDIEKRPYRDVKLNAYGRKYPENRKMSTGERIIGLPE